MAWSTTYELLRHLGSQDADEVRSLGRDLTRLPIVRFDNTQQYHKPNSRRMGSENVMRVGVAATVAEAFDFDPAAVDLDDKRTRIAESARRTPPDNARNPNLLASAEPIGTLARVISA